jgi:hypothetical protein
MHSTESTTGDDMLRNLLLSSAALAALTGAVHAADLPSQAPPPVYVPPPVFTWTGFYLGINGGGAVGDTQFNFNNVGISARSNDFSGGFVGGTIGYDYPGAAPGTVSSFLAFSPTPIGQTSPTASIARVFLDSPATQPAISSVRSAAVSVLPGNMPCSTLLVVWASEMSGSR